MASSNRRHWPSMFKSKPSDPHHQWQHDINSSFMSTGCQISPYSQGAGGEERSPVPKPRWNPKPEQIRILEAIFNSGMVNPPRDEIRKIRLQLQEYGNVGDANVFYWFQNRKSRSKQKLRHLHNSKNNNPEEPQQKPASSSSSSLSQIKAPSSSSSSSEKSSPKEITPSKGFSIGLSNFNDGMPHSPTPSVNQAYFQTHNDKTNLLPPPTVSFSFPVHNNGHGVVVANNNAITTQGLCFSQSSSSIIQTQPQPQPQVQQNVAPCTSVLLSEITNHGTSSKKDQDQDKTLKIMHRHPQLTFSLTSTVVPPITVPSDITHLQEVIRCVSGVGEEAAGTTKSTVLINNVAFEVAVGPFNVREAFGDDAVLIHSSGQPVLTDEWGVTLHSLQHGACYYLI
ncbi:WUSCHEL-related homeobox 9 [Gastrolobium bilobum]|uniref:WUSCHEL-related homeobox 9 n=1 Tax=Gastrolobium bilobum TaxID=150636 RepID=UPI002AB0F0D1|nr:WUSCHEL-related homeobox 9 [Gastrolobium bilobum]